ncbi:hypothetical protein [Opitutus sp. GAS368]|uniref:hypothetical protein n=1 Tax=Opitutus sp. GAS368 TaxID=1882749 RepID=UPI00087C2DE7|nr:hypothetical protein [Opitutus sp. GAS368]SDR81984.1 hypothetical protein SAMN05444173_0999 [Opitutus sp. GAS368]
MTADNIARLSRKLLASCLVEERSVFLHSGDYRENIALLPSPLRETTLMLVDEIRRLVPTDFSFGLAFDFTGLRLSLEFEDGNTGAFGPSAFFTSFKSLRRHLKKQQWDELRRNGINEGGIFDELLSEAQDRPVNIPSSEEAAKKWANALNEAIAIVRSTQLLPDFALIIARDDAGLNTEPLKSREEVVFTIADRMATSCDILAVLERGVVWSFPEIEQAKLEAIEQLGPISRAKAEGRFTL